MKTIRGVQYFTEEYLEQCQKTTLEERLEFLEEFQKIAHAATDKDETILISMKIKTSLLKAFKFQCQMEGMPYQTKIKTLMRDYLLRQP